MYYVLITLHSSMHTSKDIYKKDFGSALRTQQKSNMRLNAFGTQAMVCYNYKRTFMFYLWTEETASYHPKAKMASRPSTSLWVQIRQQLSVISPPSCPLSIDLSPSCPVSLTNRFSRSLAASSDRWVSSVTTSSAADTAGGWIPFHRAIFRSESRAFSLLPFMSSQCGLSSKSLVGKRVA